MIKINNIEYRNLEEQVLKNKEDIANHYNMDRVLADFGIRIIGTLSDADELQNVPTANLQYGDAYAVGDQAPYDFYIWTRADINAGHPEDYWFFLGSLAIAGPKGEQGEIGPKGETGPRGSIWMSAPRTPTNAAAYLPGDQWLNTANGFVYTVKETETGNVWVDTGNIKGPQGLRGLQGEKGEPGKDGEQGERGPQGQGAAIVKLVGTITNVSQLPDPESILTSSAYLQDVNGEWHLWVIVGQPGSYEWLDTGNMTVGTLVTDNGNPLSEYDVKNVLNGPFGRHWTDGSTETGEPTSGLVYQDYVSYNGGNVDYAIKVPVTTISDVGYSGLVSKTIAAFDNFGKIGAIGTNKIPFMQVKNVPVEDQLNGSNLHLEHATPRAYVDAQIQFASQDKVSWPADVPQMGMLLGINSDKSVEAINPATIAGESIGVECWVLQRGESRVLPRDRAYLIRGYGDNSLRFSDKLTGNTFISACTMAIGMVSSSFWPHSPADNKAWAGFAYTTGSFSLNWNGDVRGEIEITNINSGTSGSGFAYIFTLGAKTSV